MEENGLKNAVAVGEDVVVPEAQGAKPLIREPSVTGLVVGISRMLAAVAFDDQAVAEGDEVGDVRADRLLAAEFGAGQAR